VASSRKKPRTIYRCDWPRPHLKTVGIFGPSRDFPITTKELASLQKRQLSLFQTESKSDEHPPDPMP
jgi:hypothetical protein